MRTTKKMLGIMMMGVAALMAILPPPRPAVADELKKAVYHVDFGNGKRMDATLRNIYNLVNYYTTNSIDYDVRVVANSAGVRFMITDVSGTPFANKPIDAKVAASIRDRMQSLADAYDVKFEQCSITLQRTKIDKSRLKPFVTTTSSGQVRIVELQEQGYAYIKVK